MQAGSAAVVSTDVLPYYARVVAVLNLALPGFAEPLVALLADELRFLITRLAGGSKRGIDHTTGMNQFETRAVRNTKLLAELTKFGIAPPQLIFGAMQRCLLSFSHECVAVLCVALEYVGKYMLLSSETQDHMLRLLENLKKVRTARNAVSGTLADLLDAALYFVVPSDRPATISVGKVRHPLEAFVRHLLLDRLHESNVDDVLRTIRKLPWTTSLSASICLPHASVEPTTTQPTQPCVEDIVVRAVLAGMRSGASKLEILASFVAGLRAYHDRVAVRILDGLLDRILVHLDSDHGQGITKKAQKILGCLRFLGECYNYKLVDSNLIFRMLYTIINRGHAVPLPERQTAINTINALLAAFSEKGVFVPESIRAALPPYPLVMPPTDEGVGGWGFHPLVECKSDPTNHVFRLRMVS